MNIALFNVSGRLSSDGSRLISALLKRAGHRVKTIFLARPEPIEYGLDELERLDEIVRSVDLVMVAVYSSYAFRAVQITEFVHTRYPGMKVIWGGPHCISAPELALRYADAVCFSEGDEAVLQLLEKMDAGLDFIDTPNMAFNHNGTRIINEVLPPFDDLDSLPFSDYNLDDQFLLDNDLFPMTKEILKGRVAGYPYYIPILFVVTLRGCPHQCTYCNNCRYTKLFGYNKIRFQSVDRVIDELIHILGLLDFIQFVGIADDDFLIRSQKSLEEFAEKYKKEIGLPFGIGFSANTYNQEKIETLLDGGLKTVQMGVQSGSQRVNDKIYDRKIKISKTKRIIKEIQPYRQNQKLDVLVDFIIDNPYETKDDIIQTYDYILAMPESIKINLFFLSFFPGTPIYDRALQDGIIKPYDEKTARFYTRSQIQYQPNYETFLILLIRFLRQRVRWGRYVPILLLKKAGTRPFRILASLLPSSLFVSLSRKIQ
jgi:anaerobic magnesium-protoporphyrin IX monomethyl ester cyclase